MIARLVRDLLVGTVWAGALTALALGRVAMGVLLVVIGLLPLIHRRHVPPGSLFGPRSPATVPVRRSWSFPRLPRLPRLVPRPGVPR